MGNASTSRAAAGARSLACVASLCYKIQAEIELTLSAFH